MRKCLIVTGMLLLIVISGCISIQNKEQFGEQGPAPETNTLQKIEKGRTTEQWVRTVLGSPHREDQADQGVKLLVYEYSKMQEGSFSMPFLTVQDDKRQYKRVVFEIENGIVTDWWIDK